MYRLGVVGIVALALAWTPLAGPESHPASGDWTGSTATGMPDPRAQDRDWNWSGRIERGDFIEIKGINGDIIAEHTTGNEVVVEARLHGRRDDPRTVRMEVVEHADGVTICAVYPSKRDDRPNECREGSRGRMNTEKNDVVVDFRVRVPGGVGFIGRNVNGDIDALGIDGDVKAYTVNGGVDVSSTGLVEATTVNGSITASMQRADWNGTLDFTTVNGSVTLEMPDELHCEASISTVNGQISIDYPLTVRGRFSPRHVKGTIGDGGRTLVVKTVNGSVQIRRS